jgi:coenzyme F420-reducing hydrogenase delta subunit
MEKSLLKIALFYCTNNLNSNELSKSVELNKNYIVKPLSLACSGRINIQYLLKAIETGADAVILITCPQEACQFIEGNLRAEKRVMAVNSILKESGFEHERIKIIQPKIEDSGEQIIKKIIDTCNTIIELPIEGNITV